MNDIDYLNFVNDMRRLKKNTELLLEICYLFTDELSEIDRRGVDKKHFQGGGDGHYAAYINFLKAHIGLLSENSDTVWFIWNDVLLLGDKVKAFDKFYGMHDRIKTIFDVLSQSITSAISAGHFKPLNYMQYNSTLKKMIGYLAEHLEIVNRKVSDELNKPKYKAAIADIELLEAIKSGASKKGMKAGQYVNDLNRKQKQHRHDVFKLSLFVGLFNMFIKMRIPCDWKWFSIIYDKILSDINLDADRAGDCLDFTG